MTATRHPGPNRMGYCRSTGGRAADCPLCATQHRVDMVAARDARGSDTLTTWHGTTHRQGTPSWSRHQVVVMVSAASAAAARRILWTAGLPVTTGEFRDYWSETGNHKQLAYAAEAPGQVLWQPMDLRGAARLVWLPWGVDWPEGLRFASIQVP